MAILKCVPWLRSVGLTAFASDLLQEVERLLPDDPAVLIQSALTLRNLGELDAAFERLARALFLRPGLVEIPTLLDLAEGAREWKLLCRVC